MNAFSCVAVSVKNFAKIVVAPPFLTRRPAGPTRGASRPLAAWRRAAAHRAYRPGRINRYRLSTIGSSRQIAGTYCAQDARPMGQIPMPRTVAAIHIQAGARPHGHGQDGQAGRITHRAHDGYGQDGSRPLGVRGTRGVSARGMGRGCARWVKGVKYPAGKNRCHTYTCYVITSH